MFTITHLDGTMEQPSAIDRFPALLDELADASVEHGDVSVSHESGWTLSIMQGGRLVWENAEEDEEARHMSDLALDEILALLESLAAGDVQQIESRPWIAGY